jgi:hypothetical protein
MVSGSDHAEVSTLHSQLEELIARVVAVGERYAETPDSAVAGDLFAAERALVVARRCLERAASALEDLSN